MNHAFHLGSKNDQQLYPKGQGEVILEKTVSFCIYFQTN